MHGIMNSIIYIISQIINSAIYDNIVKKFTPSADELQSLQDIV